ncbi:ATP-binding cassette domain-containing protein [Streptomyces sp. NPDC046821]|uniref:ATP-binding cassette domain-containing protein n=1 Tax=Streptomyces sp. NPDC046821 TaxID=3154702 RepID=UPI0033EAAEE4
MSLLELKDVHKTYSALGREPVKVLDGVTMHAEAGQITGLVGESGSGKTTIIRNIMGLVKPDSGSVTYDGIDIPSAKREAQRRLHREVQLVFQDPTSSLNPRMTVLDLVGEGILVHKLAKNSAERKDRVVELLTAVGLSERDLDRYPRSFSGGQRQRIAIARALAVRPKLLVCDEPVSSLDVSVQAQVLNVLKDMQEQMGLTILFVAHDLAVVRQVCSTVAVIKSGVIVEQGPSESVLSEPSHEYTRALLEAVPVPDPPQARVRAQARLTKAG